MGEQIVVQVTKFRYGEYGSVALYLPLIFFALCRYSEGFYRVHPKQIVVMTLLTTGPPWPSLVPIRLGNPLFRLLLSFRSVVVYPYFVDGYETERTRLNNDRHVFEVVTRLRL